MAATIAGRRACASGGLRCTYDDVGSFVAPVLSLTRSWWHTCFALDVRSLALFRIALAMVVVADAAIRAVDAEAFYADTGMFPRTEQMRSFATRPLLSSLNLLDGSVEFQLALFARLKNGLGFD